MSKYLNIDKENFIKICNSSNSMAEASRILGIPFTSFSKIAKKFNCYNTNQSGKGMTKNKKSKYKINENYFNVWTPQMAYWLGFIVADGCIKSNSLFTIDLCSKDKQHLQNFIEDIESNDCIREYIHKNKQENGEYKEYKAVHFTIRNKNIVKSLKDKGIENLKTYIDREYINFVPNEFKKYFIIGVFDGDGNITKNGYISIAGNKTNVISLFNYLGFKDEQLNIKDKGKYIDCVIRFKKDCYKFWKIYLECACNIKCLDRKKRIIENCFNNYKL